MFNILELSPLNIFTHTPEMIQTISMIRIVSMISAKSFTSFTYIHVSMVVSLVIYCHCP